MIPANIQSGEPTWVDARGGEVPENAVAGGFDNEQLYVGRASHEGALIPGKVVPSHGVCYIAWGGQEHGKEEYQVSTLTVLCVHAAKCYLFVYYSQVHIHKTLKVEMSLSSK